LSRAAKTAIKAGFAGTETETATFSRAVSVSAPEGRFCELRATCTEFFRSLFSPYIKGRKYVRLSAPDGCFCESPPPASAPSKT
jgi:hypothetical protein